MIELKYKYLYNDKNQLVSINDAVKGNYKMYPTETEYNYCYVAGYKRSDGVEVRPHFSLKSNNPFAVVGSEGGTGESIEHYNAIMEIVFNKSYYDTIFQKKIEFHTVKAEIWHDDVKKRPDISCYDENDNLVMCIEIHNTNAKKSIDIEQLKKLNVPLIEIEIRHDNRTKHLVLPALLESNRQELRKLQDEYREVKEALRQHERNKSRTHDLLTTGIDENRKSIKDCLAEIESIKTSPEEYFKRYQRELTTEIEQLTTRVEEVGRAIERNQRIDPVQSITIAIEQFKRAEQGEDSTAIRNEEIDNLINRYRRRIKTYSEYIRFYNEKLPDTRFVS